MVSMLKWFKYRTTDENGYTNGIKKTAPKWAKKAYEEHKKLELKYDL